MNKKRQGVGRPNLSPSPKLDCNAYCTSDLSTGGAEFQENIVPYIGDDGGKLGREVAAWSMKKRYSERVAMIMRDVLACMAEEGEVEADPEYYWKRAVRMMDCGNYLLFGHDVISGRRKLVRANFCRDRLCAMCNARRSDKIFAQNKLIIDKIMGTGQYAALFVTLTLRNVGHDGLSGAVRQLMDAWKSFNNGKRKYRRIIQGYFRAFEVTYTEQKGWHPHLHILMIVDRSYFAKKRFPILHKDLMRDWQDCLGVDYSPIVGISGVKPRRNPDGTLDYVKAVLETSKYPLKTQDLVRNGVPAEKSAYLMYVCDRAFKGARLVSYGGLMAKVRKDLKLDDVENGDLVDLDGKLRETRFGYYHLFQWRCGAYVNFA